MHLDVTRSEAWHAAVASAVASFGKLDVLVNNAAIWRGEGGIEEISSENWDDLLNVNAKAALLGMQQAIPEMRRAGGGAIVNVGSTLAMHGATSSAAAAAAAGS